jgi:hypothetical protein
MVGAHWQSMHPLPPYYWKGAQNLRQEENIQSITNANYK